jgi:Ethanolamine utilization protein EutJ (predicted chaperonin)
VLAAVWRAQGHPVQIASGQMAYEAAGKKLAGVGQWALVQLDGKVYVADTRDIAKVKLVPAADAIKQLGLTISRTCASYPPGVDARKIDWSGSTPD